MGGKIANPVFPLGRRYRISPAIPGFTDFQNPLASFTFINDLVEEAAFISGKGFFRDIIALFGFRSGHSKTSWFGLGSVGSVMT
ncbi:MAG: hypothetical protein P1P81_03900 [Desulfobulbales bacterium]|nr:hypothetical protein [Desulfobulbales bacterium]